MSLKFNLKKSYYIFLLKMKKLPVAGLGKKLSIFLPFGILTLQVEFQNPLFGMTLSNNRKKCQRHHNYFLYIKTKFYVKVEKNWWPSGCI